MNGITKLTYENGWVIGLGTCDKSVDIGVYEKQYYVFWGKTTDPSLTIDNEVTVLDDIMPEYNTYIKIPFFKNNDTYFTIMQLDRKEDFEVAKKILKAVLIDE